MGLIETEIKELRQINRDLAARRLDAKQVYAHVAVYSQIEKRAKLMLQAEALGIKSRGAARRRLIKINWMGDDEAVDTELDVETEMVKCLAQDDKLISRPDCLDYSGEEGHLEECRPCEQYRITRSRLLDHQERNGKR